MSNHIAASLDTFEEDFLWDTYWVEENAADSASARSLPHLRCNFVTTLNAVVALNGSSSNLSCANDRAIFRVVRAQSDVIVVGAATLKADHYGAVKLPQSLQRHRAAVGLAHLPRLAIVGNSLDFDLSSQPFADSDGQPLQGSDRPILITSSASNASSRKRMMDHTELVVIGDKARISANQILTMLSSKGLNRILCEGGPNLAATFLEEGLVDELCLTIRPCLVGDHNPRLSLGTAKSIVDFVPLVTLSDAQCLFTRLTRTTLNPTPQVIVESNA